MTITTFQQTTMPEVGVSVTEISQDVVNLQDVRVGNYDEWYNECQAYKKLTNNRTDFLPYGTFKNYHKAGLTPIQAVKKYFL